MFYEGKNMSSVSEYIKQNPLETQRLVGLKYEQLEQLRTQAIAQGALRRAQSHYIINILQKLKHGKLES
jgi:hypothetical protein